MNLKQKTALYLLVGALTGVAVFNPGHSDAMIGILVSLFIWTVERKSKKSR